MRKEIHPMESMSITIANELAALPVLQAAAATYVRGAGTGDDMALQYLHNQRYDYGPIKTAFPFGRELTDYVRSCDPSQPLSSVHQPRFSPRKEQKT